MKVPPGRRSYEYDSYGGANSLWGAGVRNVPRAFTEHTSDTGTDIETHAAARRGSEAECGSAENQLLRIWTSHADTAVPGNRISKLHDKLAI